MKRVMWYWVSFLLMLGIGLYITEKAVEGIPGSLCNCIDEIAATVECYAVCDRYGGCEAYLPRYPGWCVNNEMDWCAHRVQNACSGNDEDIMAIWGTHYDFSCHQCPGNPWGI